MDNIIGMPGAQDPSANFSADWSLAKPMKCDVCGCTAFIECTQFLRLSKIAAATPKDLVRAIPTYCCANCGHVNSEFDIVKTK